MRTLQGDVHIDIQTFSTNKNKADLLIDGNSMTGADWIIISNPLLEL